MDDLARLNLLVKQLDGESRELADLDMYFRGRQPLSFLQPQIAAVLGNRIRRLVVNWPRLIVKSVARRCYVEGFRLGATDPASGELWRIWQANNLDSGSHLAHVKALALKRAFVMVWSNPVRPDTPRITVESPRQVAVTYVPGSAVVEAAVKNWRTPEGERATLYLPDRVVKFESRQPRSGVTAATTAARQWLQTEEIDNPLGVVPIVPLVNEPDLDNLGGESELADVIPLADALNKLATDMMISAEFHAMPRRWAVGVDLSTDKDRTLAMIREQWEKAYPSKYLLSDNPNTKFGQFDPVSLENFIAGIKLLASQIAALAGLPPHYLGINADNPASAEAIRSAEASLVERAEEKHRFWGETWEQVMRLSLLVASQEAPGAEGMETIWRAAATPTVAQTADAATKLVTAGVIDVEQAQLDCGYSPAAIAAMAKRALARSSEPDAPAAPPA